MKQEIIRWDRATDNIILIDKIRYLVAQGYFIDSIVTTHRFHDTNRPDEAIIVVHKIK